MKVRILVAIALLTTLGVFANNIIDEIAWVVGDQPIYKSEIEEQYLQLQYEKTKLDGDPYCVIPEKIAVEKLFLNQAKIDSVEVQNSMVNQEVDTRINYFVSNLGSKEKVEEYFRKPMSELREALAENIRNQYTMQEVQRSLTKNVKSTPSDVRKYYESLSDDKVPFVPQQVEAQIISIKPLVPQQEIDEVKARLRDYSERINSGESEFSTLAILYSEDGSSMYGGELGFRGKAELVPEFANVAFNLSDKKKVSKIVETEFGYHIIQLIEKRGDKVNCRHILLRPKVSEKDLTDAVTRLDSLRQDIQAGKFTFEEAAQSVSQDKDTRNNKGIMLNTTSSGDRSTKFEMGQLPQEVAKQVDKMNVGEISPAFIMTDQKTNKEVVAIVKLTNRIEGHKANLADDYQTIKGLYEASQRETIIGNWIKNKIKNTYVRIEDGWRNCDFEYEGWLKDGDDNSK